jgi:hypothetical protein
MGRASVLKVDERALANIPRVPFTDTWSPVHHHDVMQSTLANLAGRGIEPEYVKIELSQNGFDMFSNIVLPREEGQRDSLSIGVRNSMQKHFSLGFAGGHRVIVCSNMCFFGEFVEHRKHTSGLSIELMHSFIGAAIDKTFGAAQSMRLWYDEMHEFDITTDERKLLTYQLMEREIISPSKFNAFQTAWKEELKDNSFAGVESMAHFHGATTRVLRANSISVQQSRTLELNSIVKEHIKTRTQGSAIDHRFPISNRWS